MKYLSFAWLGPAVTLYLYLFRQSFLIVTMQLTCKFVMLYMFRQLRAFHQFLFSAPLA